MEFKYSWLVVLVVQLAVVAKVHNARKLPLSGVNFVSPIANDENYAMAKCPYFDPFCNQPTSLQLVPTTRFDLEPSLAYTGYPDEAIVTSVNIPRSGGAVFRSKRFFSILSPSERLRVLYYRSRGRQGAAQDTAGDGPANSLTNLVE